MKIKKMFACTATAVVVALAGAWVEAAPAVTPAAATTTATATAAAPVGTPLTAADVNAWLDGYLPYALKSGDISGAVVVVVKDGAVLTERGFGYSDVEKRVPVDPAHTLFRPGSVSKLVTWTAVMQMVEQGKIDLDADINQYLDFKVPGLDGKPITMRNLMQHTAGFEEQAKGIIAEEPSTLPPYDALLKVWVPERIFAPGTTPAYSNYGASLAAYIVQRVSGEGFDDYLDKHIFAPLDMKESSFRQPLPAALKPLMSKGYPQASEDARPYEIIGPAPAGSLASSGEDMAHFMIAHLQNGEYHGNRILKAETAEQMHNSPLTMLPPLNRMELGFFETNINDREVIGHLGDTDYFHTSLHLFLKDNVGFYVSFSSPGKDGAAGGLRGAMFQDFADRYFPAVAPKAGVDEKTSAAHSALMSGTWAVSRTSRSNFLTGVAFISQTKVGVGKKGELVLPFPGLNGKPRHWIETAPFVWFDEDGHDRAAAKVVDGKPVRFSFDMLSPFMVFERVPWYADSALLMPLFLGGAVALLLTTLVWPVAALVRRRYKAPLALAPASLKAYRWSRIAALLILLGLGLWLLIFTLIFKDTNNLSSRLDPLIVFAQLFGIVAFIGGLVLMLWNLKAVWSNPRRWPARLWSLVLAFSAGVVLWLALVCKLLSFGTHY
jgi:CubicO group peptidase (beta-lactamase class C family)